MDVKKYGIWILFFIIILFSLSFFKRLFQSLGIMRSPEEKALDELYSNNAVDSIDKAGKSIKKQLKDVPPTKSEEESLFNANVIYDSLKYGLGGTTLFGGTVFDDSSVQKAYNMLERVNNDSDVLLIVKAFGNRTAYYFGIIPAFNGDLKVFVNKFFNKQTRDKLNFYYQKKKIKYQF